MARSSVTAANHVAWVGDDTSSQAQMIGGAYGTIDCGHIAAAAGVGYAQLALHNPTATTIRAELDYSAANACDGVVSLATGFDTTPTTISHLDLSGDFSTAQTTVAAHAVVLSNPHATIAKLTLQGLTYTANATGPGSIVLINSACTVTELNLLNCRGIYPAGAAGYYITIVTGAAVVSRLNCIGGSVTNCNTVLRDASTATTVTTLTGGFETSTVTIVAHPTSPSTKTFVLAGCRFDTVSLAVVYLTTANAIIKGDNYTWSASEAFLARAGTETCQAIGLTLPLNLSMLSRTTRGDMAFDAAALTGTPAPCMSDGTGKTGSWKNWNSPGFVTTRFRPLWCRPVRSSPADRPTSGGITYGDSR